MSADGVGLDDDDRGALKDLAAAHRKRGRAGVSIEQCREWRRTYASADESTHTIAENVDYARNTVTRHVKGRCGHEHDTRGDGA